MQYIIQPRTGAAFELKTGDTIVITDIFGGQVADFFAVCPESGAFLSTGATMDANASIKVGAGSIIYTNGYKPMFEITRDGAEAHDILFPSCRPEMFDFFYNSAPGHPNCLDNLNAALSALTPPFREIRPLNLFMRAAIAPDGSVRVLAPLSKAGDSVALLAKMDCVAAVAACSVSESDCNAGACTAIGVEIVRA